MTAVWWVDGAACLARGGGAGGESGGDGGSTVGLWGDGRRLVAEVVAYNVWL